MVAAQAALHLDQLLEVMLRETKRTSATHTEHLIHELPNMADLLVLTPCFMVSLAWLATAFTISRAAERREFLEKGVSHRYDF